MASTSATVNGWRARASKVWYPTDGTWKSDGSSTGINVSISDPTGNNKYGVIFFYLSNEGVSMLENAAHLGLPVPDKLKDVLQQLHEREGK